MCLSINVGGIQDSLLSTVNGFLTTEFDSPRNFWSFGAGKFLPVLLEMRGTKGRCGDPGWVGRVNDADVWVWGGGEVFVGEKLADEMAFAGFGGESYKRCFG